MMGEEALLETPPGRKTGDSGYWRTLVRGTMVLYSLPALALLLHQMLPLGPSLGLTLLACLPVVFLMREHAGAGFLLSLSGLALAGLILMTIDENQAIADAPRLIDVTVKEASLAPQAGSYYFKDAIIWRDKLTEHRYRSKGKNGTTTYYYVAPLTDPGWSPEQPVRAWVVASSHISTKRWSQGKVSGVRWATPADPGTELRVALDKAQRIHDLTSAPEPLLIKMGDPDALSVARWNRMWSALPVPLVLWSLGWTVWWVWRRIKAS